MALTAAQQTEMDKLKAIMDEMEKEVMGSYSLKSIYGSYFFEQFEKLKKQTTAVESA